MNFWEAAKKFFSGGGTEASEAEASEEVKNDNSITLDEAYIVANADKVFDGATPAQKKSEPRTVLKNDGSEPITFNTVLEDGSVEVTGASLPAGGYAVIQPGGEVNVMADFDTLYENVQADVGEAEINESNEAMARAGIAAADSSSLTVLTATAKQRVDQYVTLPYAENGASIDFVIMKPWGDGGALVPQKAKSGDALVSNGANGSVYFNDRENGTLHTLVSTETGEQIDKMVADGAVRATTLEAISGTAAPASNATAKPTVG